MRSTMLGVLTVLVVQTLVSIVTGQTWCNKHYMINQSVNPPGGQFPLPGTSGQTLLAFRCAPAIKPYLAEDSSGSFIIDTKLTHSEIAGTAPISASASHSHSLFVTVSAGGHTLTSGLVPLNASGHELDFSLESLQPQKAPFEVTCSAVASDGRTYHSTTTLQRLPNPTTGGVTKMDLRTGAMLVKASNGDWETVFPIGFYTNFDGYLSTNLTVLDELKAQGFTIVHPVPTFDNLTALGEVLDHMEEVGLYLMYDMRYTYMNLTSVREQVNMIKDRKNLLLWYTGDEPDGTFDPLNATEITYNLINELDGYHPVSLVLNCQDFDFTDYIKGADVVMQDTYPIAINATFSVEWHTPCTPDFGDCGCDNCKGVMEDISDRMDEFAQRLDILGQARTKTVWAVPQAFGGSEYWARAPTGNEWLVESILSINHGATGIVPWADPTPADIKQAASNLALVLPTLNQFLFEPNAPFIGFATSRVDVGIWTLGQRKLLLATNLNNVSMSISLGDVFARGAQATQVLNSGGTLDITAGAAPELSMGPLSSIGYIIVEL